MDGWTRLIHPRTLNVSSHIFCLLEGMRDVEGWAPRNRIYIGAQIFSKNSLDLQGISPTIHNQFELSLYSKGN
jgi:hypothetical protein